MIDVQIEMNMSIVMGDFNVKFFLNELDKLK